MVDKRKLGDSLRSLREELADADAVGTAERRMLIDLRDDIEELLELSSEARIEHKQSVKRGLAAAVERFQQSHPDLTRTLGNLLDTLTGMGI